MTAAAEALIGNEFRFQVGAGDSPETYADMCSVVDFGEVGEEKPLIDITTLCSEGREYRNGLADGLELAVQCNYVPGDTQVADLYADYQAGTLRNFKIVTTTSPADGVSFAAIVRGWKINAPVGDKSAVTFTLKISGAVTWEAE